MRFLTNKDRDIQIAQAVNLAAQELTANEVEYSYSGLKERALLYYDILTELKDEAVLIEAKREHEYRRAEDARQEKINKHQPVDGEIEELTPDE